MFHALDFTLFGVFLLLSLVVGLYHGIAARVGGFRWFKRGDAERKRTHTRTDEFLTGGRRLPVIPVCLSLLSTFTSGIGLLSVPAEIYTRGFTWGLSYVSGALAFPIIGVLFIPVFYKLQFLNAYEYFEMRFHCALLRRMATLLFMVNTMIYLAVVVYAPAIALTGVTGIELWWLILAVGGVCTVYTAAGGIKAVIWTDTLQAVFIYVGLAWLIIKGTIDAGGFGRVMWVNEASGRLTDAIFKVDLTLLQYNSAWISVVGGLLHWLSSYGLNQMAIQRYCSMPSLKDARTVLWLAMPAILLIAFLFFGTISSGINSLTTVLWEDFLKVPFHQRLGDSGAEILIKVLTVVFGVIAIAMAFACYNLGGIFHVCVTILGATTGPLVGLFFLGIFSTRANKNGAMAGLIGSTLIMVTCTIVNNIDMPYKNYVLQHQPSNYISPGCVPYAEDVAANLTRSQLAYYADKTPALHYGHANAHHIALVSPFAYSALGVLFVLLIGVPVSYLFPQKLTTKQKEFSYACTFSGRDVQLDESVRAQKEAARRVSIDLRAKLSIQSTPDNLDPLIQ